MASSLSGFNITLNVSSTPLATSTSAIVLTPTTLSRNALVLDPYKLSVVSLPTFLAKSKSNPVTLPSASRVDICFPSLSSNSSIKSLDTSLLSAATALALVFCSAASIFVLAFALSISYLPLRLS